MSTPRNFFNDTNTAKYNNLIAPNIPVPSGLSGEQEEELAELHKGFQCFCRAVVGAG